MSPYDSRQVALPMRTIRRLAIKAWADFGLTDLEILTVRHGKNTVIEARGRHPRVSDGGAKPHRFALRLHRPGYHDAVELESELCWLHWLADAGLPVPRPIEAQDGRGVVQVIDEAHVTHRWTLLGWIGGDSLDGLSAPIAIDRIGELVARIHNQSGVWTPPAWFRRPTWDAQGFFADPVRLNGMTPDDCWALVPPPQRSRWRDAADAFANLEASLDTSPAGVGLIHGDPTRANLLSHENEMRIVDFDDCGTGYYAYDCAVAIGTERRRSRSFAETRERFLDGYARRRPVPIDVASLDHFFVARVVSRALWVLSAARHRGSFASNRRAAVAYVDDLLDAIDGNPNRPQLPGQ